MSTKMGKPNFACTHCTKEFVRIGQYNKHTLLCEMMHKTEDESRHDMDDLHVMPSSIDMYRMLQILTKKYVNLEKKVDNLTKENSRLRKRTKMSMIAFLNQHHVAKITLDEFFDALKSQCDIKHLFNNSLFDVFKCLIDNYISTISQPEAYATYPILHFKNFNTQCMYTYSNNSWEACSSSCIINGCKSIETILFQKLNIWQTEYGLDDSGNIAVFTETAMKLVSNDTSVYQKIRKYIMEVFTLDIKAISGNIDDYEITN